MSEKMLLLIYFIAALTVSFQWFKPHSTMSSSPSEIIRYFQCIYSPTKPSNVMATIIPIFLGPNLLLAFNTSLHVLYYHECMYGDVMYIFKFLI